MTKRSLFPFTFLSAALALGGCGVVLGLDDYTHNASSSSGNAGQGGSAGEGTGGNAGTGGTAGSGGTSACMPGTKQPCYSGPIGTEDVGMCKAGEQTCLPEGTGFGPCTGEVVPTMEICSMPGDENCDGSSCSETTWARIFGDAAVQYGRVVAPDGMGGVYFAGSMEGTVDFDGKMHVTAGGRDIFLTRIGPDGKCMWSQRFGDAVNQDPTAITVDAMGNVYLAAIVEGVIDFGGGQLPAGGYYDIAIASFDPTGKHRWSRRYGAAAAQEPHGLAITPTGELVVAGSFGGTFMIGSTTLTSAGDWDMFVAKLDSATGDEIWTKQFGTTTMEQIDAVAVDTTGNIITVGRYGGYVNLGGNVLPYSGMAGDLNVFVLKLDSNGKHSWSNGFGDSEAFQFVSTLAVDSAGAMIFAGEFEGVMNFGGAPLIATGSQRDIYLTKLASNGTHVWSKQFGGAADDRWPRVTVDPMGNSVFISCYFTYSIDFGGTSLLSDGSFDIAVARLNADGSHVWSRRFGETPGALQQQTSSDIAWSPKKLFVAGSQMGTTDYGTGVLTSAGSFDAAVFAIGP